jgi:hypothetical protein
LLSSRQGALELTLNADQQIGQMYELMQAIRKQELEENDPEYKPDSDK